MVKKVGQRQAVKSLKNIVENFLKIAYLLISG